MIPFFKKIVRNSLTSQMIALLNDACHSDHQHSLLFLMPHSLQDMKYFYSIFYTETLFQTKKIDDNTNERYAPVFWKDLYPVTSHIETQLDRRKIPKIADVCVRYGTT